MKSEYRLENARIVDIGLHYIGHYRQLSVRAELATRGGGWMHGDNSSKQASKANGHV